MLGNHAEGSVAGYNDHLLVKHGMQYAGNGARTRTLSFQAMLGAATQTVLIVQL